MNNIEPLPGELTIILLVLFVLVAIAFYKNT